MKCDLKILQAKIWGLVFLELALVVILVFSFNPFVSGGVGTNVTVITNLTVGNVHPEILNVTIHNEEAVTLTANDSTTVWCEVMLRDYNNDTDLNYTVAYLFDTDVAFNAVDDNNTHYTNGSCLINRTFGTWNEYSNDSYNAVANCTFDVEYFAEPGDWNCSAWVNDSSGLTDGWDNDTGTIDQLLAIGLPPYIDYGTVNATDVSTENITNVSNVGNVDLNVSFKGYSQAEDDGWAMNCSLGSLGAIDLGFEKYNHTGSHAGTVTYDYFEGNYTNLTSSPVIEDLYLGQRQNDTQRGVDDVNQTYWRIYVPLGVAGTCNGTIEFGATTANAA